MTDIKTIAADEHCRDCCCARSWAALGITSYTGKSIPEHIAELRKPQPLKFPRANEKKAAIGWTLDPDYLQRVHDLTTGARFGTVTIQAVLLALEALTADSDPTPCPQCHEAGEHKAGCDLS